MDIEVGANVKFHNNGQYLFGEVTRIWGPKANRRKYVTIKSHSGKTFVRYMEDVQVMGKLINPFK
jgi:hypothetical protein